MSTSTSPPAAPWLDACWAAQALRFDERDGAPLNAGASAAYARWIRHYAGGDADALTRRLGWDGWTRSLALARFASPAINDNDALPAWAAWLRDHLHSALAATAARARGPIAPHDYPAAGLWRAWVDRACLRAGLNADDVFWRAAAPLLEHLARRLALRASAVLAESAAAFKQRQPLADHAEWQAWLGQRGLCELLHAYPVLARQLAETSLDGIDAMTELAYRLHHDKQLLGAHFGAAFAESPLRIESTGSDPHRRGRQVLRMCFADGILYFKPRPMAAEVAFGALIDALAAAGLADAPPHAAALDRGNYGYVAHVSADAINLDGDELQRYHRRAGTLIALAWLLNTSDLHQDNVIATRAGPVLVDLETLLQPEWPQADGIFDRAHAQLARSCLASGLLYCGHARPDGGSQNASGLRGEAGNARSVWTGLETLCFKRAVVVGGATLSHRVLADGRALDSAKHADAIEAGFAATLVFIAGQRDRLLVEGGALDGLRTLPVRVVLRATRVYANLLDFLATPAMQRDGALSLLATDRLNRPFRGLVERPPWWSLVAVERAQLEAGDVPVFETRADACGFPGHGIDGVFATSAFELMRARVAALGAETIAQQRDLLAGSLLVAANGPLAPTVPAQTIALQSDAALKHARAFAQALLDAAVRGSDGLVAWPQEAAPDSASVRGFGGDFYLYQGSLGIVWFLTALAACEQQDALRAAGATAGTLRSLARVIESQDTPRLLRDEGFGAAHGLGSLLLGLHAVQRIDPIMPTAPLIDAVLARIDPQRIAVDPDSDLHAGVAGLLLALAAVQRVQPRPGLFDLAQICVSRLQALADADGLPRGYGGVVRSGAAHGLTGIAFALAHAAVAFGHSEWRHWALQLVAAEDQSFDPLQKNWRPQHAGTAAATLNAWCNGAGGILLLRTASGLWRDSEFESAAIAQLDTAPCAAVDHLCCGLLGRAETLALLGDQLARPALRATGQRIAAAAMARPPQLDRPGVARLAPGLFRGTAGIGMALLRLHVDATLPSPLLFGLDPLPC